MTMAQIPNWFSGAELGSTKDNPFPLPDAYMAAQQRNVCFKVILNQINKCICYFCPYLILYLQFFLSSA